MVVKEAERGSTLKKSGRDFKVDTAGKSLSRSRIVTALNVLGSVGYYQNGPQLGITACIEGFSKDVLELADELEEKRESANRKVLGEVRERGLSQGKNIQ